MDTKCVPTRGSVDDENTSAQTGRGALAMEDIALGEQPEVGILGFLEAQARQEVEPMAREQGRWVVSSRTVEAGPAHSCMEQTVIRWKTTRAGRVDTQEDCGGADVYYGRETYDAIGRWTAECVEMHVGLARAGEGQRRWRLWGRSYVVAVVQTYSQSVSEYDVRNGCEGMHG